MRIQLGANAYGEPLKKGLSADLFLDEMKSQAAYEIRKENGYIRHYVTKANGEVVMIKETKLPKSQQQEQSAGNLQDLMKELAVQQLTQAVDQQHAAQWQKTGLAGQKEKQLEKYKQCI